MVAGVMIGVSLSLFDLNSGHGNMIVNIIARFPFKYLKYIFSL
jgi:hypothetical protein